jgi:hypothetical protein
MREDRIGRFRLFAVAGIALLAMGGAVMAAVPGGASGAVPAGANRVAARTGSIGPGQIVHAQTSSTPFALTAAQRAARARAMAGLAAHKAPKLGRHTTAADVSTRNPGPQTSVRAAAPTDLNVLKNSLISSYCSGCGQATVNEPSVANNGKYIVETSNWNIAYSTTGATGKPFKAWKYQNPYSMDAAFCCDQAVTYDPGRNVFVLLQLAYAGEGNAGNGLDLSIASGTSPTSWCRYHFAGAIGGGATDTPDYPKIAIANGNAYLTWNDYPPNANWARTGLARMPLDSLASCAGFSYGYLTRTDTFTFAMSQADSSLDQFYWMSNWYTDGSHTNGAAMRIYYWAENSGTYFYVDRAVNAYTFGNVSCGSPNWCSRLDPRWETVSIFRAEYRAQANSAFAGDSILEVATTAGPSGFSGGKNYVVYNYFKLNALSYIGNDQTYSTSTNFAYAGCAPNYRGYVGCSMATGTNTPGGLVLIKDAISPTQPWAYTYPVGSVSGASAWGDYIITSPFNPGVGPFQTVLWNVSGTTVQPYYIVWGRNRESGTWKRWHKR